MNHSNSNIHQNVNRPESSASNVLINFQRDENSISTNVGEEQTFSLPSTSFASQAQVTNRPITRSFVKSQQSQTISPSQSLTSLSSSTSSLSSFDIINNNQQSSNVSHPIEKNSFNPSSSLNQSCFGIKQKNLFNPIQQQSTHQKIIINEKPCNLLNIIESSRLNGRMIRCISNVNIYIFFCFA
jgi:hypothetical protein